MIENETFVATHFFSITLSVCHQVIIFLQLLLFPGAVIVLSRVYILLVLNRRHYQ
jgi:hypothetical protein